MRDLKEARPTPESIVGCPTCPFKTKRIGGRGPYDSPFVIVGESPGAQELARTVPFVGPSGQLIKQVLEEVGFDSLGIEPYITNALSCYPVDKDLPKMKHATSCCHGRLHEELLAYPREVILCLGASAAWAVTGDYTLAITRDRGKVLQSPLAKKGVVLAVHPAYLMRNGGGLPFWKKDLRSAVELYDGRLESHWEEPIWNVIDDRAGMESLVRKYMDAPYIGADYETDGLQALFNRVIMLGITRDGRVVDIISEKAYYENLDLVKELMENEARWIWQNGKFDIQWSWNGHKHIERIRRKLGIQNECGCCPSPIQKRMHAKLELFKAPPAIKARCDEDTMLISYALNENSGFHDLDQIAQSWIQAPAHKTSMSQYYKMAPHYSLRNAPIEDVYKYAAFDIAKTFKMFFPLEAELKKDERLERLYRFTLLRATPFFARMESYGVGVDKDKVKENVEAENTLIDSISERLQVYAREYMKRDVNFGSYLQVRELLWKHLKLGPPGSEKGNNWREVESDEQAIIDAQRRTNHPILHDLLNYREVTKRKSTFVINLINHYKFTQLKTKLKRTLIPGITGPDGRVHANWLIHGTGTGRPAGRNPNMLNQPRVAHIRDQYKALPGKIFIEVDLNQAELRSLAILSKDPLLMDIYTKNEVSIHDITTAAFFASKAQMAEDPQLMHRSADLLQYFGERTPTKVYKEAKMAGKTVNFGIVYGREAHSIAQVFNVPHQEAQRWIDTWLDTYSGAAVYIEKCRKSVIRNQRMVTPWGRMKRVGVVSQEKLHDYENQAANFPHQSIAHDILLEAAMECEERLLQEWDAHPWNEIYDAIYLEVDDDEEVVKGCIDYVCDVITEVPKRYGLTDIPFIGDAKVGPRWGSMEDWAGSYKGTLTKLQQAAEKEGKIYRSNWLERLAAGP